MMTPILVGYVCPIIFLLLTNVVTATVFVIYLSLTFFWGDFFQAGAVHYYVPNNLELR